MQTDSEKWKQDRIRILDFANIAFLAVTIPAAICFFFHNYCQWNKYVDARNWTEHTARVISTSIERDWDTKTRKVLIVKMTNDGGPQFVDAFNYLKDKEAIDLQSNITKRGTVLVFKSNLVPNDYAFSREVRAKQRYVFPLLFGGAVMIFAFFGMAVLWRYLRRCIADAAGTHHRFQQSSARLKKSTNPSA